MAGENINRKLNIYINDKEVVNSMSGVTRAMAATRNEIKHLNKGAADYDEQLKKLKETYNKLSQEQTKFRNEIAETPGILKNIKNALGPVASGMIAAFSIGSVVAGTMAALGNAKKLIFEFEQGVADLSSITGATGKDLDFLKNKAIQLGEATQGGAVAVLEAYKLIASAKPELLENVDALNQVTEATLLLAKASGMEMPAAATALTDAMNQFGVDASQASIFVDALANGAKYGAAEIPQVTEALLKFGAVARTSNVDILESTALVELLAENGLKGAEAGTALRNVLLKLSAVDALPKEAREELDRLGISMEYLKDKTIPIQEKLETLKPLLRDNASIVKVFGTENATAAINVIAHTERLKELTSKMGEVGTAEEQAAIKMETAKNKAALLQSKYESLIISVGSGTGVVSNFFKFFIDGASDALTGLIRLNASWDELHGKAKQDGTSEGIKSFTRRMAIGKNQGGNELDVAKNIKSPAAETLKRLVAEYKKNEEDVKKYQGDSAYLGFGESGASKRANEKKEALTKEINMQATLIREANKKIADINNPKTIAAEAPASTNLSKSDIKEAESAAKKREKAIENAKKHSEELLNDENDLQKSLNDSRAKAEELKLGLIKDDYERERALLNADYDKKIDDLELNLKKEQEAIDKLKSGIASPKSSSEDVASFKKQLKERLEIQENYNKTMLLTDQTRDLKLGALQEKYLEKSFQKEQEEHARSILLLKTKQNNELAGITTLAQAKEILSATMTDKELSKITTLEKAKKAIKEQNLKELYVLEMANLAKIIASYEAAIKNDASGLVLLSDEERDKLTKALDEAKAKIAEIKGAGSADAKASDVVETTGVDILGYDAAAWENTFNNLDTFQGKMDAIKMIAGGLTDAFSAYFKFLEAGENRTLQKFQKSADSKKRSLADQLEKGAISQEVYNARVAKIDQDLAKKKAEIEYKQAKRQKTMQIVQAVVSTAVGIMQAYAQLGPIGGTIAAVLIGAMGAFQVATIAKQPLPDKSGFKKGGYTGDGPNTGEAGPAHFREYVIPEKVLFSNDPVVPNIVGYLEAKRTGKQPMTQEDSNASSGNSQGGSASAAIGMEVVNSLNRNSAILEKIEENGMVAYLVNDIKTAKKMRDKIKEVTKLETNAKV